MPRKLFVDQDGPECIEIQVRCPLVLITIQYCASFLFVSNSFNYILPSNCIIVDFWGLLPELLNPLNSILMISTTITLFGSVL